MPGAVTVLCFAHLDQDVSDALPFLNAELGGFTYIKVPPSVTFRLHGKLLTVHGNKIAVNALKAEAEARKIVEWIKREINDAWEKRDFRILPVKAWSSPWNMPLKGLKGVRSCFWMHGPEPVCRRSHSRCSQPSVARGGSVFCGSGRSSERFRNDHHLLRWREL